VHLLPSGQKTDRVQDDSVLFPGMADLAPMDGDVRRDGADAATATSSGPPKGSLSNEDIDKKARGTFSEFLSIRDFKEAEACVSEMRTSEEQEAIVVAIALQTCFDAQVESERTLMYKLLVHLADARLLSAEGIRKGLLVRPGPCSCLRWWREHDAKARRAVGGVVLDVHRFAPTV
jgi:hypothetical protein